MLSTGRKAPKRALHKKHDVILYYASKEGHWNAPYGAMPDNTRKTYNKKDENGRAYKVYPGGRQYLDETPGRPIPDWWDDIASLGQAVSSSERYGYPTQKPLKLYDRIIRSSTRRGDWVLEPFAGCATTCVAAQAAGRKWNGIDIWDKSYNAVVRRLEMEGLTTEVIYRTDPPARTDQLDAVEVPMLETPTGKKRTSGRLSQREREVMKARLIEETGLMCLGCDRVLPHQDYLDIDHRLPVKDGGTNDFANLCLLCQPCNRRKTADHTLTGLRKLNKKRGFMGP